ncbi:hypothetical protein H920_09569 [Fukomys damarensis]|uniref:Uncharacterized protein n=1 Tax=Fukomys damarensis TaxID=885580 RepID=A0A091DD85_FUKDA|nr:hypothetical protein H920_09569 [Fukomys damarensis]
MVGDRTKINGMTKTPERDHRKKSSTFDTVLNQLGLWEGTRTSGKDVEMVETSLLGRGKSLIFPLLPLTDKVSHVCSSGAVPRPPGIGSHGEVKKRATVGLTSSDVCDTSAASVAMSTCRDLARTGELRVTPQPTLHWQQLPAH